jgi:hypothetical protein
MTRKQSSAGRSKTSSVSRSEVRAAVLGVKAARTATGSARKATARGKESVASSVVERYLGHFGVGSARGAASKGATAKKAPVVGKKTATRKAARRAS